MTRIVVQPEIWHWAIDRSGQLTENLNARFPKLVDWINGDKRPTLKQLERFAKACYAPIGYFFLDAPPEEQLLIPDRRTVGNRSSQRPSVHLLDTIGLCQQRQDWYRRYVQTDSWGKLTFVGSVDTGDSSEQVANIMRETLNFGVAARATANSWAEALRLFIQRCDDLGLLVMVSGVVGGNNSRLLSVTEFRGFALSDEWAPLIFINGNDSRAAQMFTLAHELAHIWLGESALTDTDMTEQHHQATEPWCNAVAAEFLVPRAMLQREANLTPIEEALPRLVRHYKVSKLVMLYRLLSVGLINLESFRHIYDAIEGEIKMRSTGVGGNFYRTTSARLSRRLVRGVVSSTLEGHTSFTEAFQLLSIKKASTLVNLGRRVEASP